jgi:hypothetical protein
MNAIRHNDPDVIVTFDNDKGEVWEIGADTRHGKRGFRVLRHLNHKWDENYMFFTSLDAALTAFKTGRLHEGRAAF